MRALLRFASAMLLLAGCSSPGDDAAQTPSRATGAELGSRHFLQFIDRRPALAAGEYTLVPELASDAVVNLGQYELSVRLGDGSERRFTDRLFDADTRPREGRFTVTLDRPGGLDAQIASDTEISLALFDRSGNPLARSGPDGRIAFAESLTDDAAYARAYYAAIDPRNRRDTLQKWRQLNGFERGADTSIVFRDTKDLGYGRRMSLKRNALGGGAIFVENYQITNAPGQQYSPLNLDAAIEQTQRFHISTNAIEFGPIDTDGDGTADDLDGDGQLTDADSFARFYTFSSTPPFERRLSVDMDGQGEKHMPTPCASCHGGRVDPLLPDGRFPRAGDIKAHLHPIPIGTLDFSTLGGFTRADQESALRSLNLAVYDSYLPSLPVRVGSWNSAQARALLEAWYGGPGLPNASFEGDFVPLDWTPGTGMNAPPVGADALYRDVVADNCRGCHLLLGAVIRGTAPVNHEIDFASFGKFISYRNEMEPLIFDKGLMPLSLVAFGNFFDTPDRLRQLIDFLPGFTRVASDGRSLRPGRPIADAGPDRISPSPVALSASASLFPERFEWRIASQPEGGIASLAGADSARPVLSTDREGIYRLELRVSDAGAADTVQVTVDPAMARPPQALNFEDDIQPVLSERCVVCHAPASRLGVLPPLFLHEPAAGENRDLYDEVRARINFVDPEESPLLTKPIARHHGARLIAGFDLAGDRSAYDLFLAWILEGARER